MRRRFSFKSKPPPPTLPPRPSSPSSSSAPHPLSSSSTSTNYPNSNSNSTPTRRSTSLPSPTVSLTHEYSLAVHTNSYNEIWSKIHIYNPENHPSTSSASPSTIVSQVLQPNRDLVHQALHRVKPTHLTKLVSAYFDHSEQTSHLLWILLHHSIERARTIYSPLHDFLDVVSVDSLSQPQCDRAFDIFVQFNLQDNPFPYPISENFRETRLCFTELKQQLDYRLVKARRQTRFHYRFFRNSALCLGTLVSNPLNVSHSLPSRSWKKQLHHISQLDAASKGAYVLNNDLDTIDRLVARLHAVIESDKVLIRIGLQRGRDKYPIQEVVKQLRKNHPNFLNQLKDLEEHVCLCFATVNRARSLLLQEMDHHRDHL